MTGSLYGTLGPACACEDTLRAMFAAGMRGMRLNLSHGTLEAGAAWIGMMQRAAAREGVRPELIIDLQGPELRIGAFPAPILLAPGEMLTLGVRFPVPLRVMESIVNGEELLLDDGQLALRVTDASQALCRVERGGTLLPRKSIAVAGRELPAPALTALDRENLRRAPEFGVTGVMQPFVRGREDLLAVRAVLREENAGNLQIFAKIENQTGLHKWFPRRCSSLCSMPPCQRARRSWMCTMPRAAAHAFCCSPAKRRQGNILLKQCATSPGLPAAAGQMPSSTC